MGEGLIPAARSARRWPLTLASKGSKGLVDVSLESIDSCGIDQPTDEHRPVMVYRASNAVDRELVSHGLRYQLAGVEILDDLRPRWLAIWGSGVPKRLVTEPHEAALGLSVPTDAIPRGEASNVVEQLGGVVRPSDCTPQLEC
jgi:hypothetical protein